MRRCARSMNTTKAVTPSTTTTTNSSLINDNSPLLDMPSVCTTAPGRPATIPAKISSEIPLPIPRSVICSPSHIRNSVPAVSPTTDENTNPNPGVYTTGAPPAATLESNKIFSIQAQDSNCFHLWQLRLLPLTCSKDSNNEIQIVVLFLCQYFAN